MFLCSQLHFTDAFFVFFPVFFCKFLFVAILNEILYASSLTHKTYLFKFIWNSNKIKKKHQMILQKQMLKWCIFCSAVSFKPKSNEIFGKFHSHATTLYCSFECKHNWKSIVEYDFLIEIYSINNTCVNS